MAEQPLSSDNINRTAEPATLDAVRATWTQTRAIFGVILLVLVIAAGLWMVYTLRGVILLVVLAMFFAYLIAPLVDVVHRFIAQRMRGRLIPRAVAIGLVIEPDLEPGVEHANDGGGVEPALISHLYG